MNILFISENFYPESNALANRLYDHAKIWVKHGHQVTILTCAPNFPKGKVFAGYKNKWRYVETIEGIKVIRIKSYIAENRGLFRRILDYMSFGIHAAIQGLLVKSPDIIIGSSPQPFAVFASYFVAKLKRKPFVFELRDLWPESVIAVGAMGKQNILLRFFAWTIKRMYKFADIIVSVTDSFKKFLVENENISATKIIVCKNGVNLNEISPTVTREFLRSQYKLEGKYVVGYVGTIGMAHSISTIIEAAKTNDDSRVHFIIMGAGAKAETIKQQAEKVENITFVNSGSRQDAINVLNMLDASIVHLKNTPLFKTVIPSKIFEAMALGIPILIGIKGESHRIVIDEAQAGCEFEPQNSHSLNKAIALLQRTPYDPQKSIAFVKQYFNRECIATRMLQEISERIY